MQSPLSPAFPSPTPTTPATPATPALAPDPAIQAEIDAAFRPVPIALSGADKTIAVCTKHALEQCTTCKVDLVSTNRLAKLLAMNSSILCPPPPNVVSQKLSQAVNTMKEEGNLLFKKGLHAKAISRYTMAANVAVQRPPWEASQFLREELSTVISNRSAAYFESGDYIGALVDADTVISIRRNWSKGHFRKAKALLGLARPAEAKEAIRLGLAFEPNNTELNSFLAEMERVSKVFANKKSKQSPPPVLLASPA